MLPKDLKRPTMSAQDWKGEHGKSIPKDVSFQDVREGVSWLINTINTKHVIPDAWTGNEKTSQVALMPDTYFPHEGSSGAVAAAGFSVYSRQFDLVRRSAANQGSYYGVRGGVRINEA